MGKEDKYSYHPEDVSADPNGYLIVLSELGITLPFEIIGRETGLITQVAIDKIGAELAAKIWILGQKLLNGIHPGKELQRLERDLGPIVKRLKGEQNAPWSNRNKIAEGKLPKSGCIFSKGISSRFPLRGPDRYPNQRK